MAVLSGLDPRPLSPRGPHLPGVRGTRHSDASATTPSREPHLLVPRSPAPHRPRPSSRLPVHRQVAPAPPTSRRRPIARTRSGGTPASGGEHSTERGSRATPASERHCACRSVRRNWDPTTPRRSPPPPARDRPGSQPTGPAPAPPRLPRSAEPRPIVCRRSVCRPAVCRSVVTLACPPPLVGKQQAREICRSAEPRAGRPLLPGSAPGWASARAANPGHAEPRASSRTTRPRWSSPPDSAQGRARVVCWHPPRDRPHTAATPTTRPPARVCRRGPAACRRPAHAPARGRGAVQRRTPGRSTAASILPADLRSCIRSRVVRPDHRVPLPRPLPSPVPPARPA